MSARCDLHELENCGLCNGAAKRLEESLTEPEIDTSVPLERIPGGVSIYSQFPGTCDGCGNWYPKDTPIFRPSNNSMGWVRIECCITRAI